MLKFFNQLPFGIKFQSGKNFSLADCQTCTTLRIISIVRKIINLPFLESVVGQTHEQIPHREPFFDFKIGTEAEHTTDLSSLVDFYLKTKSY